MSLEETMAEFKNVLEDLEHGNRIDPQKTLTVIAKALDETIKHVRNLTYLYRQMNPIITSDDIDKIMEDLS